MREAIGSSLLLNIIVIFVSLIMLFFVSILSYSKAYRAKNRIIDVIEKYEEYNIQAISEITSSLSEMGYQLGNCQQSSYEYKKRTASGEVEKNSSNQNNSGYKYCVYKVDSTEAEGGYYYRVTAYVQFYFPILGDLFAPPVYGETKILGKSYNY